MKNSHEDIEGENDVHSLSPLEKLAGEWHISPTKATTTTAGPSALTASSSFIVYKAVTGISNLQPPRLREALYLFSYNEFQLALELLEKEIDVRPYDIQCYYWSGRCQFALHDYDEALRSFSTCLELFSIGLPPPPPPTASPNTTKNLIVATKNSGITQQQQPNLKYERRTKEGERSTTTTTDELFDEIDSLMHEYCSNSSSPVPIPVRHEVVNKGGSSDHHSSGYHHHHHVNNNTNMALKSKCLEPSSPSKKHSHGDSIDGITKSELKMYIEMCRKAIRHHQRRRITAEKRWYGREEKEKEEFMTGSKQISPSLSVAALFSEGTNWGKFLASVIVQTFHLIFFILATVVCGIGWCYYPFGHFLFVGIWHRIWKVVVYGCRKVKDSFLFSVRKISHKEQQDGAVSPSSGSHSRKAVMKSRDLSPLSHITTTNQNTAHHQYHSSSSTKNEAGRKWTFLNKSVTIPLWSIVFILLLFFVVVFFFLMMGGMAFFLPPSPETAAAGACVTGIVNSIRQHHTPATMKKDILYWIPIDLPFFM